MAGRGRPLKRGGRRGRSNAPTSAIGKMLQDYFQPALHTTDFASLASGAEVSTTLVDNSSDFENGILKWSKLVIRPIYDAEDIEAGNHQLRTLLVMLHKRDEDDSSQPQLDSEETIRELRLEKRIVRGPWAISTPRFVTSGFAPAMAGHMKPFVLRNFVMDREQDLVITFTNISGAFGATSQALDYFMKGFVRVIK